MPAQISKTPSGRYMVRTPNAVHAKGTTLENAQKQKRLLNAIDHGFVPTKKKTTVKSY
jgi:hypothetical protein